MQEYLNNIDLLEEKINASIEDFNKKIINIANIESNILVNSFYDLDLLYNIAFFIKEIKQEDSKKAQELINLIKNYLQSIQSKIYLYMKNMKKNSKYSYFFKRLLNKMKISGILSNKEKYEKITKYHTILLKHLDTVNDLDIISFIKLFVCRNKLAKITGFNNYGSYASGINQNSVSNIRNNIFKYSKILDNIHIKDIKKLDMINIEKYLFKPSDVMFKIIADMTNLLGLKFIVNEEKEKFKWSENVVCLDCFTEDNKFIGTIYLDMIQDLDREEDKLSVVKMMNRYDDYNNPNVVVIFADYYSLEKECIDYNTVLQLYKAFACAIEMITNVDSICLMNDEDTHVRVLLDLFIELYVFSSNTIGYFIQDKKVVSFIKRIFHDNFMYSQKKLCVDTLLDNILYNDDDFVKIFIDNSDNEKKINLELISAYQEIANELNYPDLNLDKTFIDKNLYNGGKMHIALYSSIYANKLITMYKKNGNIKSFCKKILVTDRHDIVNKLNNFFN